MLVLISCFKNFQGRYGVQLERHTSKIKIKKILESSNYIRISFLFSLLFLFFFGRGGPCEHCASLPLWEELNVYQPLFHCLLILRLKRRQREFQAAKFLSSLNILRSTTVYWLERANHLLITSMLDFIILIYSSLHLEMVLRILQPLHLQDKARWSSYSMLRSQCRGSGDNIKSNGKCTHYGWTIQMFDKCWDNFGHFAMVNQVVPYFDDRVDVPTLYWWELGLYCLVFVRPQQNSAAVFRDFFSIQMFFFFFF